jgi:hypothetical protein
MSRDDNRARMPVIAALVDELRAQGLMVKVLYAKENGVELGRMPEYREVFDIPRRGRMEGARGVPTQTS